LGTFEFPFKKPVYAAKEIFNFRNVSSPDDKIKILVKRNSWNYIEIGAEALYFVNCGSIEIGVYPEKEEGEWINKLDQPVFSFEKDSYSKYHDKNMLNPWTTSKELLNYDFQRKIDLGELTKDESKQFVPKFLVARTNLYVHDIFLQYQVS